MKKTTKQDLMKDLQQMKDLKKQGQALQKQLKRMETYLKKKLNK